MQSVLTNKLDLAEQFILNKKYDIARSLLEELSGNKEYQISALFDLAVIDSLEKDYSKAISKFIECLHDDFLYNRSVDNLTKIGGVLGKEEFFRIIQDIKSKTPLFIFLHIPKTAGATFLEIIQKNFPTNSIFEYNSITAVSNIRKYINRFDSINYFDQLKINCIPGHFAVGIHEKFNFKCEYFTFFRDPIERTLSEYYFIKSQPNHLYYPELVGKRMDIKTFLDSGIYHFMDNGQTRLMAGVDYLDVPYGHVDESMLNAAIENLENHFPVIGITELFSESVRLLQNRYKWKDINYSNQNVNKTRKMLDEHDSKILENIKKYNQFDIDLYNYARRKFNKISKQNLIMVD